MIIRNQFLRECIYNSEQKLLVCVFVQGRVTLRGRERSESTVDRGKPQTLTRLKTMVMKKKSKHSKLGAATRRIKREATVFNSI